MNFRRISLRMLVFYWVVLLFIMIFLVGILRGQSFDAKTEADRYVVSFWRVDLAEADFTIGEKGRIKVIFLAPDSRKPYDEQADMIFKGSRKGMRIDFDIGNGSVVYTNSDTAWFDVDFELMRGFYEMAVKIVDKAGLESKYWGETFTFYVEKKLTPKRGKLVRVRF